jgi:hypothetical protein
MKLRAPLLLSVPLGIVAFLMLTARALVSVVDGPDETLYGFPLFWIKAGPTSLSYAIDLPAAAIDLVVYVLVSSLIAVWVVRVGPKWLGGWAVRVSAWLVAVLAIGLCVLALSIDPFRGGVTFNPAFRWANIRRYSIYLGVPGERLSPAVRVPASSSR